MHDEEHNNVEHISCDITLSNIRDLWSCHLDYSIETLEGRIKKKAYFSARRFDFNKGVIDQQKLHNMAYSTILHDGSKCTLKNLDGKFANLVICSRMGDE